MSDEIQVRRGTAAEWTAANPVLAEAEPALETDTRKVKYGDGVTNWNTLPYATGGGTGAPIDSPAFTGNPTAPTPVTSDNDTSIATTAFVKAVVNALINSAPTTLDTLGEIAAQLASDESAVAALTTSLASKAPLASPTFTGDPKAPTPTAGDNDTSIATTAFVASAIAGVGGGIPTSTVDAKGDLLVGTADNTVARQAAGADGTVVMYDSSLTTGVKAKALDDSDVAPVTPNSQTGTTYTFVAADKARIVLASNASAQTYTIPPNSSVAYPTGTSLQLAQQGAGQVTIAAGAGVTLRTPHGAKTSAQYAIVTAIKVATDEWYITGDTTT